MKRRLRAATAPQLGRLPLRSRAVVRALPASAAASYEELSRDLLRGLDRAVARLHERQAMHS